MSNNCHRQSDEELKNSRKQVANYKITKRQKRQLWDKNKSSKFHWNGTFKSQECFASNRTLNLCDDDKGLFYKSDEDVYSLDSEESPSSASPIDYNDDSYIEEEFYRSNNELIAYNEFEEGYNVYETYTLNSNGWRQCSNENNIFNLFEIAPIRQKFTVTGDREIKCLEDKKTIDCSRMRKIGQFLIVVMKNLIAFLILPAVYVLYFMYLQSGQWICFIDKK